MKLGQCDQIVKFPGDAQNALQALPLLLSAVERARAADKRDASCALLQAQIDSLQAAANPYAAKIACWQQRHDDHEGRILLLVKRFDEIKEENTGLKVLEEIYERTGFKAPAFLTFSLTFSLVSISSSLALRSAASASLMRLAGDAAGVAAERLTASPLALA